jgi:hypothetical protein
MANHANVFIGVVLLGGLFMSSASDASADLRAISVGEVSARAAGADPATENLFRSFVTREVDRLDVAPPPHGEAYVFSASLVRFDTVTSNDATRAVSVVSGTLRRASTGALVAFTQGRGSAESVRGKLDSAKMDALAAAVHGAVKQVPAAL